MESFSNDKEFFVVLPLSVLIQKMFPIQRFPHESFVTKATHKGKVSAMLAHVHFQFEFLRILFSAFLGGKIENNQLIMSIGASPL